MPAPILPSPTIPMRISFPRTYARILGSEADHGYRRSGAVARDGGDRRRRVACRVARRAPAHAWLLVLPRKQCALGAVGIARPRVRARRPAVLPRRDQRARRL